MDIEEKDLKVLLPAGSFGNFLEQTSSAVPNQLRVAGSGSSHAERRKLPQL